MQTSAVVSIFLSFWWHIKSSVTSMDILQKAASLVSPNHNLCEMHGKLLLLLDFSCKVKDCNWIREFYINHSEIRERYRNSYKNWNSTWGWNESWLWSDAAYQSIHASLVISKSCNFTSIHIRAHLNCAPCMQFQVLFSTLTGILIPFSMAFCKGL